jgi:small subunit ribosomal protein S16
MSPIVTPFALQNRRELSPRVSQNALRIKHRMLSIRLSRVGKKGNPTYRLIVTEKSRDPWGKFLENLGTLDPMAKPKKIAFDVARIKYWMSKGAQPTPTVRNLLIDMKEIEGEKVKAHPTHKAKAEEK